MMHLIRNQGVEFLAHFDLHETTDTDNTEFRPALAARDAKPQDIWQIPDGFYTVGDTEKPAPEFQKAIIASVEKVTHIAPPDAEGNIIGEELQQWGVINYRASQWGLCMGMTGAPHVTTTEVYPDSPKVPDGLLKIGYTHYELKQWDQARAALVQVQEQYPDTTLARLAGNRLRSMKLEGHY